MTAGRGKAERAGASLTAALSQKHPFIDASIDGRLPLAELLVRLQFTRVEQTACAGIRTDWYEAVPDNGIFRAVRPARAGCCTRSQHGNRSWVASTTGGRSLA